MATVRCMVGRTNKQGEEGLVEGRQWKDDKGLQGAVGWGCRGAVKWGRKDSENFRVNMFLLVYLYTIISAPLDL